MGSESWQPTSAAHLPLAHAAVRYAEHKHAGQLRGDGSPFLRHPLEVGSLLYESGAADHVIAAGVLHDVIEKTDVTASELRMRFGPAVASLVLAVTDDGQIEAYSIRKAALRRQVATAGDEALAIFAADKLSKLRELRREAADDARRSPSASLPRVRARRLTHYRRSLSMLQERLPESPLVRALGAELGDLLGDREVSALA